MNALFIKELFAPCMADAMVGPEKDDGVIENIFVFKPLNELAQKFVGKPDGIEVGSPVLPNDRVVGVVGWKFDKVGIGICGITQFFYNEIVPVFTFAVFATMQLDLSKEGLVFFSIGPIITIIDFRIKFKIVIGFAFCDLRESAVGSVITSLLKKCGYRNNFVGKVDFN